MGRTRFEEEPKVDTAPPSTHARIIGFEDISRCECAECKAAITLPDPYPTEEELADQGFTYACRYGRPLHGEYYLDTEGEISQRQLMQKPINIYGQELFPILKQIQIITVPNAVATEMAS